MEITEIIESLRLVQKFDEYRLKRKLHFNFDDYLNGNINIKKIYKNFNSYIKACYDWEKRTNESINKNYEENFKSFSQELTKNEEKRKIDEEFMMKYFIFDNINSS
jgi:predicted DNA-binding protein YlxM (UPF0122 family)